MKLMIFSKSGIGSSTNLPGGSTNPPGSYLNNSGGSGSQPGGPGSLPGGSSGHPAGLHMTGTNFMCKVKKFWCPAPLYKNYSNYFVFRNDCSCF